MRLPLLAAVAAAGSLILASLAPVHTAGAQAKPDRLKTVLAQMDAGSAKFHSAEALIEKQQFEKIVNDTTTESGTIYFLRSGNSIAGREPGSMPPNAQTLEYKNGAGDVSTRLAPTTSIPVLDLGRKPGAGRDRS